MTDDRERIRVFDGHYLMEEEGYVDPEPILHVYGRDSNYNRRHVEIEGFHPYLTAPLSEVQEMAAPLDNDHRVRRVEWTEEDESAVESVDGKRLAKVYTIAPYHVPKIRENFSETYEADVRFFERFVIDEGIKDTMSIPTEHDEPLHVSEVRSSDNSPLTVPPRIGYVDIEVEQTDDGPSVVSDRGIELADSPITAITIYDNYTKAYEVLVLAHDDWTHPEQQAVSALDTEEDASITVFPNEKRLLASFISHVDAFDYDVLTAWNGTGFDFPYTVNRLFTLDHPDRMKLSPVGIVDQMNGNGSWVNEDLKGRILFDLLAGYEKTIVNELPTYSLEYVAKEETDIEKLSVEDIDTAWRDDPETFVKYNLIDVKAMVLIDQNRGILV